MVSELEADTLDRAGQRLHVGERREAWWRGPAVIDGDWIVLDRERWEPYHPRLFDVLRPGENPLTELAAVRRPQDAVAFARSFGMLYPPPPDEGPWRESLRMWEQQAWLLRYGLALYADVQATMAERTPARMRALRETWSSLLAPGRPDMDLAAATDVEVFSVAADTVVSIVNDGIADATERAAVAVDEAGPQWFMADPRTPDLLTFVYVQLQTLVTGLVPLRTCADPACGRSFTPDDPRARYCQPAHGNRARARRSRQRGRAS